MYEKKYKKQTNTQTVISLILKFIIRQIINSEWRKWKETILLSICCELERLIVLQIDFVRIVIERARKDEPVNREGWNIFSFLKRKSFSALSSMSNRFKLQIIELNYDEMKTSICFGC